MKSQPWPLPAAAQPAKKVCCGRKWTGASSHARSDARWRRYAFGQRAKRRRMRRLAKWTVWIASPSGSACLSREMMYAKAERKRWSGWRTNANLKSGPTPPSLLSSASHSPRLECCVCLRTPKSVASTEVPPALGTCTYAHALARKSAAQSSWRLPFIDGDAEFHVASSHASAAAPRQLEDRARAREARLARGAAAARAARVRGEAAVGLDEEAVDHVDRAALAERARQAR